MVKPKYKIGDVVIAYRARQSTVLEQRVISDAYSLNETSWYYYFRDSYPESYSEKEIIGLA